ncbi:hypothetical protein [Goodfellowiella coeruleoviolacea]|uniref:Uncharacterized protein n=1 Tax=Goodfellowiella coeruleoviolacea TaxID=334858 RepID=A0AAE3KF24_9PSEU|nr:hypothetical protein [Goodfellowiella coeruleoviolacea]MCP2165936.1 hypothetical protein [Goodfellowiella coeruleoviolacea]
MRTRHFWLVSAEDENQIFAIGMEITHDDDQEAVIFRRDPLTRRTIFGVHESAAQALNRYGTMLPMKLVWQDCGNDHRCLSGLPADALARGDHG